MRRRAGESFLIGPDIEIEILDIGHNRVRIGICAPTSVQIVRKEVALTRDQNLTAARALPPDGIAKITEQLRSAGAALTRRQDIDVAVAVFPPETANTERR
jgi:carbon storage regulator